MIFESMMLMAGLAAGSLGVHKLRQEPLSGTHQRASTLGEHAWLEAGPERVAEAWMAALIDGAWVTVEHNPDHTPGRFRRVLGVDPPTDHELTDALYALPDSGDVEALKKAWRGPMNRLHQQLVEKGLLVDERQRRERAGAVTAATGVAASAMARAMERVLRMVSSPCVVSGRWRSADVPLTTKASTILLPARPFRSGHAQM